MTSQLSFLFRTISTEPGLHPDARTIVDAVVEGPKTTSQLYWLFRGRLTKADLMPILQRLAHVGIIKSDVQKSGGRPRTVWSLVASTVASA